MCIIVTQRTVRLIHTSCTLEMTLLVVAGGTELCFSNSDFCTHMPHHLPSYHTHIACLHATPTLLAFMPHPHCLHSCHTHITCLHATPTPLAFVPHPHCLPSCHTHITCLHATPTSLAFMPHPHHLPSCHTHTACLHATHTSLAFMPHPHHLRSCHTHTTSFMPHPHHLPSCHSIPVVKQLNKALVQNFIFFCIDNQIHYRNIKI